jgi:hypothetical protein
MTTRYQKKHSEDVARILRDYLSKPTVGRVFHLDRPNICQDFADLFAADNPPVCRYCRNTPRSAWSLCVGPSTHEYGGGFDRAQFLAACGLESEG